LGEGEYEPVRAHHSWDSAHRISGLLLINLQRHSDHHLHPMRRFPPLWRRKFNPRVRAWRKTFYPEIEDWTPYKTMSFPPPRGAG
jgi:alkane 1-monooxygenase